MQTAFVLPLGSMEPEPPDAELARAIAGSGDARDAERALVRRFAPRIRLYGLRHLGSEEAARDLVQDVILKVLVALRAGRLENADSLASFVLGTCRHVVWDGRRAEQRARVLTAETAAIAAEGEPQHPLTIDFIGLLRCLQHLPERDRVVVRMSFNEDRSADDIGQRLGITAGNVRVIRHRALARLGECLGLPGERS